MYIVPFLGKFTCDHGNWLCLVLDQYGQMGVVLGGETGMVFSVKITTTTQQQIQCGNPVQQERGPRRGGGNLQLAPPSVRSLSRRLLLFLLKGGLV